MMSPPDATCPKEKDIERKSEMKIGSTGKIDGGEAGKQSASSLFVGLDLYKLFFALCIVAIHTYAIEALPSAVNFWITQSVFRLAVPFFFITSGFLLGRKMQNRDPGRAIFEYIKRLLPLLVCVETANGLLEWFQSYLKSGTSLWNWFPLFVKHACFYPYGAMWYVQACIIGAAMLYPFLKRNKLELALIIGGILHVWALLCNNYYFLAQAMGLDGYVDAYMSLFLSGRNGFFVGFLYMALGIKTWQWHQKSFKTQTLLGSLVICGVAYLIEIGLLEQCSSLDDRALYLTQIALAPVMVLCIVRMKFSIANGTVGVLCRRLSTWIYFSHRLIYSIGKIACFLLLGGGFRGVKAFVAVSVLSVLLSMGYTGYRKSRMRQHLHDNLRAGI